MRTLPLWLLPLALACGPAASDADVDARDTDTASATNGGGGGPGGGPGGGGPSEPPPCTTACWTWLEAPVQPRPVPGAAPTPYVNNDCNVFGVDDGRCPDGFSCGAPRDVTPTYAQAMCEPDEADPWALVLDIGALPPDEPTRDVTLTFTRNDEAWPTGAPGSAGLLVLRRASDGQKRTFTMPTDPSGTLAIAVPEGTWNASFQADPAVPLDTAKYASVRRPAALVVAANGDDNVDVDTWILELTARLDGAAITTLPADASWTWTMWSPTAGTQMIYVQPGESVRRRYVVEPGPWDITAYLGGDAWPDGNRAWVEAITTDDLDDRNVAAFEATFTTAAVSGAVRMDGVSVTANTRYVTWTGTGTETFEATTTGGATRYEGRVLAGETYEVRLTSYASPDGSLVVASGQAPGVLDVRATVVPWSGTVTANGAPTRGYVNADITHTAPDGSSSTLDVTGSSGANFNGYAWDKVGETRVQGDGERLPGGDFLVESGTRPRTGRAYDLDGVAVTIHLTLNGVDVNQTDATYYGSITLSQVDPATGEVLPETAAIRGGATASWTRPGPFVATALLPVGTYALNPYFTDNELTPAGFPSLGTATVRRAGTIEVDARTWRATVELLADGQALDPVPGGNRGEIQVGSARFVVPGSGRARASVEGFVSEQSTLVAWTCYPSQGCGAEAYLPTGYRWLWSGLWLVPP